MTDLLFLFFPPNIFTLLSTCISISVSILEELATAFHSFSISTIHGHFLNTHFLIQRLGGCIDWVTAFTFWILATNLDLDWDGALRGKASGIIIWHIWHKKGI